MGGLRFIALRGGLCVPAVELKYTFALHRLDQQFAERPYQGINAVRRISACFESAMEFAARNMKITLPADHAVDAEIDLGPESGAFSLAARLYVSLPGMDRATAERLVEVAHQVCPYSRATHGNIAVETTLV